MRRSCLYILLVLMFLGLWELVGRSGAVARLLVSAPSLVYSYFLSNYQDLVLATGVTFLEAFLGLLIASVFSFSMMMLCFYFPKFMNFVMPVMVSAQVVPLIVLAPFFIILMGIGLASKIAMAALMCFFPIFVNFGQGYRAISSNVHDLMHIYNASAWKRIKLVYFPLSLPSIMAGMKISATLAVIGAIVAEFNGAEIGLGKNLFLSAKRLEPDLMMASLLLATALGLVFFGMIYWIERKFGYWYNDKKSLK